MSNQSKIEIQTCLSGRPEGSAGPDEGVESGGYESRSWLRNRRLAAPCTPKSPGAALDLAFESLLMEVVADLSLVFQQPVDARLMTHRLADHLGGGLAVDVEERRVV